MASIRKHGDGWRAEVARRGVRRTKKFQTRQEAKDWASRQEYLILNEGLIASRSPFRDVLDRYAREVSPQKAGSRWEVIRLEKFGRDRIADKAICDLEAKDFADWRDRRLREISSASVRREMSLLSAVMTQCRSEWGLITQSPMLGVKKPPASPPRSRRPTAEEIERLAHSAGDDLSAATARAFAAFLFAIETGMRAGEIVGLMPEHISGRTAHLAKTKNGHARDVPLSKEALRILGRLPKCSPVFGLSSRQLDVLWRKVRDRAAVQGLHFHDSRHEAVTRLSKKLDVLTLAKMIGHRDINMLMVYYESSADEIAGLLD